MIIYERHVEYKRFDISRSATFLLLYIKFFHVITHRCSMFIIIIKYEKITQFVCSVLMHSVYLLILCLFKIQQQQQKSIQHSSDRARIKLNKKKTNNKRGRDKYTNVTTTLQRVCVCLYFE